MRVEPFPRDLVVPEVVQSRSPKSRGRAEKLLRSLLTPSQLEDWRATRRFWVDTPRGPVQLGELYSLVHHPIDDPGFERVLCVVPHQHTKLPVADIWSNLLLVLAVEPERFFRVAIERGRRPRGVRTRP